MTSTQNGYSLKDVISNNDNVTRKRNHIDPIEYKETKKPYNIYGNLPHVSGDSPMLEKLSPSAWDTITVKAMTAHQAINKCSRKVINFASKPPETRKSPEKNDDICKSVKKESLKQLLPLKSQPSDLVDQQSIPYIPNTFGKQGQIEDPTIAFRKRSGSNVFKIFQRKDKEVNGVHQQAEKRSKAISSETQEIGIEDYLCGASVQEEIMRGSSRDAPSCTPYSTFNRNNNFGCLTNNADVFPSGDTVEHRVLPDTWSGPQLWYWEGKPQKNGWLEKKKFPVKSSSESQVNAWRPRPGAPDGFRDNDSVRQGSSDDGSVRGCDSVRNGVREGDIVRGTSNSFTFLPKANVDDKWMRRRQELDRDLRVINSSSWAPERLNI